MHRSNIFSQIHTRSVADALLIAQTSKEHGLSQSQYSKRLALYGENRISEAPSSSLLLSILKELQNPLAIILLVAALFTIILGEYIDTIVILIATVINVVISLYQERQAHDAFRALSRLRAHSAVVMRAGVKELVPAEELVLGDVVLLKAGDYIPADGRIIQATRLQVNQVVFTGESRAVDKSTRTSDEDHPFDRKNMLFMGCTVVSGEGSMIVTATGDWSRFGTIAKRVQDIKKDLSPVQRMTQTIATWIGVSTVGAVIILLGVGVLQGQEIYTTLLLAVAVGVSAVPEGLLSAVTVVLAFGARNIMKQGALVKNLSSAETLGSASYILTDKTGTLTYGKLKVEKWYSDGVSDEVFKQYAVLATDVFYDIPHKRFVGYEMDTAIVQAVFPQGDNYQEFIDSHIKLDTIPFDSSYKFFASLSANEENEVELYIKGAPEILLAHSAYIASDDDGGYRKLSDTKKKEIKKLLHRESSRGRRLVAVAKRSAYPKKNLDDLWEDDEAHLPSGLVWCGVVSFYDRIRRDVPEVIAEMRKDDGIEIVMLTGDNPETAQRVAFESGVVSDRNTKVYTGQDIDKMEDEELAELILINGARIFARVVPTHKLRLARILHEAGEVVAMTGDGVNDALALSQATIGISLSSSTEVAKEAADLVLIDDAFGAIVAAIREGRRMMTNIKKTIIYLLSTSFSEVIVLLASFIMSGPLPFYPTQILWANIIEEGLMNFAFIFEPRERNPHPDEGNRRQMVGKHTRRMVVSVGLLNGAILIALYLILLTFDISDDTLRTYMFAALSIDSIFFALALKSLYNPIWRLRLFSNMYLIGSSIISFALLVIAMTIPFLQKALHLEPIGIKGFSILLLFGAMNLLAIELVKAWHRPRERDTSIVSKRQVGQGA